MLKRLLLALVILAAFPGAALAQIGSNTTCLTLFLPTPNVTGNSGIWGASINTDLTQIDQASAGYLTLALPSQSGYPTVTLTSNTNAVDQSRNAHFNFTGTLTSNTTVLWPASLCRSFTVSNQTTGTYSTTLAVNNGSGGAAGATVTVGQGQTVYGYSDGTNIISLSTSTTGYFYGGIGTGTTAQVVASAVPSGFTLTAGYFVNWIAGGTTTGPTTLAFAGTTATATRKLSSSGLIALVANDIVSGQVYTAVYDGTYWEVLNPSSSSSVGGSTITMSAAINWTKVSLASGSTVSIGAAAANYIAITGTTGITAFDTIQAGTVRVLEFAGSLTLTYNATSLILPNAANLTTQAGDVAIFISEGSGNWRLANYQSALNTEPLSLRTPPCTLTISGSTYTPNFDTCQQPYVLLVHASCPCTIANPSTTLRNGQNGVVTVVQSSTGSDTVSWGTSYKWAGATAPTLSTGGSDRDYFAYFVDNQPAIIMSGGVLNAH